MSSLSRKWTQQWALLRRRFTVMLLYPMSSLLRILIWPALVIAPVYYIVHQAEPGSYGFSSFVNQVTSIVMITTVLNVYSNANTLVADKATGMKSLMLSMGLSRFNYYCAMSIYSNIFILPVVLVIMTIAKVYLIDDSLGTLTLISIFLLFSLQLDAFVAAAVSFITASSYSFIVPAFIFLGDPWLDPLVKQTLKVTGDSWQACVLFGASSSPYEVLRLLMSGYADSHKTEDDIGKYLTQPIYLLLTAQVFWIVVFRTFAWWFEEVCPWQKVSAVRDYCFCLKAKRKRLSVEDDSLETPSTTSRYFEHRSRDSHDVGIKINHVTKSFNAQYAVNDVSFTIYKGETTLLLGHNGAGKSTLMNIILGLLEPNNGYVEFKKRSGNNSTAVGVCPQISILDDDLTVRQHLELFNDIKSDISGAERSRHIHQTIADISLAGQESKRPKELSGGMKRKLSLGLAFVGKSDVLILDEPSSGLDPDSRVFVWNAIRRYRSERTVLLSTQHMEEADYLGDRVAIMSAGRIVCCGSSVYLNKLFGKGYKLRIECKLSKSKQILDYIRSRYFDAVHPTENDTEARKRSSTDPTVDLTLELETSDKNKDYELELIKLLEDLESNSEKLSIRSYGLKSSSIEDVMLYTSKYFTSNGGAHSLKETPSNYISTLSRVRSKSKLNSFDLFQALMTKHLQVCRSNWFSIIFLKIALPLLDAYLTMSALKHSIGAELGWQNPGLTLMIGHLIYYPTRERASKFKIMQLTSGASVWIYWLAQILFDIVWMIPPLVAINIFASVYITRLQVGAWELHGLISIAFFCFYLASMVQCYCLSNAISNAQSSVGYLFIISAITSALGLVVYLFRMAALNSKGAWLQSIIDFIGIAILPTDALSYFFVGLPAKCYFIPTILPQCIERESVSPVLIGFSALIFHIVAYSLLLIFIESQSIDIEWYFRLKNLFPCFNEQRVVFNEDRDIDRDVVEETTKALTAVKEVNSPCALIAAQLNKSYIRNNKIIENLSFTVNKGECFGLLGVNGAGKTTTFSMLVTEVPPDSGKIMALGYYSHKDLSQYRKILGFDPQSTPEMSLSPYQALSLMARLRGLDYMSIPMVVSAILNLLEMSQHTHKYDNELSGGTKRKLALGMSLIGNPSILALDEPTAGVDPLARRSVWQLLKALRTNNESSIIISSHAMEECEAICDRITIMARGRLRCIGTFLHLRSKFAKGCTLRVQLTKNLANSTDILHSGQHLNSASGHDSSRRNQTNLGGASGGVAGLATIDTIIVELHERLVATIGPGIFTLADKNVNSLTYNITDNRVRRSILFKMMRDLRQKYSNVHYMINDASLEDIFISLAREQQELEAFGEAP